MAEKIDNLEEQLLNGTDGEEKGSKLPPFIQKILDQLKSFFKKNDTYTNKVNDKHQFIISLLILLLLLL